jgi:hypothetical protein
MRALIIASPWVEEILAGRKVWELRGSRVRFRERIALIRGSLARERAVLAATVTFVTAKSHRTPAPDGTATERDEGQEQREGCGFGDGDAELEVVDRGDTLARASHAPVAPPHYRPAA